MAMYQTWEQRKAEGHAEGSADALLTVLGVRGIAVSETARARILAQRDPDQLKRWLQKAVVATTIDDVLDGAG